VNAPCVLPQSKLTLNKCSYLCACVRACVHVSVRHVTFNICTELFIRIKSNVSLKLHLYYGMSEVLVSYWIRCSFETMRIFFFRNLLKITGFYVRIKWMLWSALKRFSVLAYWLGPMHSGLFLIVWQWQQCLHVGAAAHMCPVLL